MAKVVSCRDVGVNCDYVVRGRSDEEILRKAEEHSRKVHGMKEFPEEYRQKIRRAIHEEAA